MGKGAVGGGKNFKVGLGGRGSFGKGLRGERGLL